MAYWARTTATVLAVLLLVYLALQAGRVIILVFLGFFLAAGFDPPVQALERRGIRRGLAVLLLFAVFVGVLTLFVVFALRPALAQLGQFIGNVPTLLETLGDRSTTIGRFLDERPQVRQQVQDVVTRLPNLAAGSLTTVFGIVGTVVGVTFSVFTVLVLAIYFLLAMPRIRAFAARALETPERVAVFTEALGKVGAYVTGQFTVCGFAGAASFTYFTVAGVPYAAVLALAVAILDAVPQVGGGLAGLLGVLVALTVGVPLALLTLGYFAVYQQIENYVIAPRVFSRAVALSPVAVLVAVLVGASLAGFVGAVVALPVTAALKVVSRYVFRDQLAEIAPPRPTGGAHALDT